jgi:hypothetical protein
MIEKDLLKFAIGLCRAYNLPVCHVPNAITRNIGGKFISIVVDKGNAGWPDIIALGPEGRLLLMELKTETGRLRPEQVALQKWCAENGHAYTLCRTTDEIEQAIKALAGG